MYQSIVRRRAALVFERLGRGEWEKVVSGLAEDVHHVFPGDHPLGGERHRRETVGRWFERLYGLFVGHDFEVDRVVSRGGPWNTWVAVQWRVELRPRLGEPYENQGSHWINIRWGRVVAIQAYLDTQPIAEACAEMARAGVPEADAPPIVDA